MCGIPESYIPYIYILQYVGFIPTEAHSLLVETMTMIMMSRPRRLIQHYVSTTSRLLTTTTSSRVLSKNYSHTPQVQATIMQDNDNNNNAAAPAAPAFTKKKDYAADVRTLVEHNNGFAVLSTISKSDIGYPGGSVVGFAPEPVSGRPLFSFSDLSAHTRDLT
jgi:hypothetical protein